MKKKLKIDPPMQNGRFRLRFTKLPKATPEEMETLSHYVHQTHIPGSSRNKATPTLDGWAVSYYEPGYVHRMFMRWLWKAPDETGDAVLELLDESDKVQSTINLHSLKIEQVGSIQIHDMSDYKENLIFVVHFEVATVEWK